MSRSSATRARGAWVKPWARSAALSGPGRAASAARRAWNCSGRVLGQSGLGPVAAGVAEGGEGLQEFGDPGAGGAGEALGQLGAQGLKLLRQGLGPIGFGAARGGRGGGQGRLGLRGGAAAGVLEVGTQPADEAAALLGRALGVEGNQALQEGFLDRRLIQGRA